MLLTKDKMFADRWGSKPGIYRFTDIFMYFMYHLALRPNDKEIHKLAGHLLFENGAF